LDSSNNPHITYMNEDMDATHLKYAFLYNGGWHVETVCSWYGPSSPTSLVLDCNDLPHVAFVECSYLDPEPCGHEIAWFNGGVWQFGKITDCAALENSRPYCLKLDTSNNRYLSMYNSIDQSLMYATSPPSADIDPLPIYTTKDDIRLRVGSAQGFIIPLYLDIPENGMVHLDIYDIRGRRIQNLINDHFPAGEYRVEWNTHEGKRIPNGMYIITAYEGGWSIAERIVIIR